MRSHLLKLLIIPLIFFTFTSQCYAQKSRNSWVQRELVNESASANSFSIVLELNGTEVIGQYCSVTRNGGKIDCGEGDMSTPNIKGAFNKKTKFADVGFVSFFGATGGRAKIKILPNSLSWSVYKVPAGGEYYGPNKATLIKGNPPAN